MELSKAAEERLKVSHFFCLRMEHLQKGSMSLLTKRDNTTFALGLADPEGLVCCLCHCSTGASLSSLVLNQNNKAATTMINLLSSPVVTLCTQQTDRDRHSYSVQLTWLLSRVMTPRHCFTALHYQISLSLSILELLTENGAKHL